MHGAFSLQCSGNEVTYALTDSAKLPSSSRVRPDSTGKGARAGTRVKAKGLPYSAMSWSWSHSLQNTA